MNMIEAVTGTLSQRYKRPNECVELRAVLEANIHAGFQQAEELHVGKNDGRKWAPFTKWRSS
jgi:hypothetical protein